MSRDGVSITCRGVTRTYRSAAGSTEAVTALDALVPAGSLAAIVGPSGSGKSTLLRLLAGIDAADGGEVVVGDTVLATLSGRELRRLRAETVGYVAQRAASNLIPQLTLREQLGAHESIAERLGVAPRIDARAGELSGGEQARAALAVALARETSAVLADEPTAELDRDAAAGAIAELRHAADEGRTVVVATHDPDLVSVADVVLDLAGHPAAPPGHARSSAALGEAAIVADGIVKRYGGKAVVDDVSLTVRAGEAVALLGRSGSGKSTLLMVLGGWTPADAGTASLPAGDWRATSYVAQRFALFPELTIAENVALPLRLTGTEDERALATILEQLDLAPLAARLPHETSIGQQQRAALARALVASPRALLADEPTSHQDAVSARRIWHALALARAHGTACLVATHDEAAAAQADRVMRIADGRISE